jgi:hypothetical protein
MNEFDDDDVPLPRGIAQELLGIATAVQPLLGLPADEAAQRLEDALEPEWELLDAAGALEDLHYGLAMAGFGVGRLEVRA